MNDELITIPARRGKAARLTAGGRVKVISTHGSQVVDTWAFRDDDLSEFMSMEHCRAAWLNLRPAVGDAFVANRRRAILSLVEDSSPGVHDTLLAACNRERYELLGCEGYHENCQDNLVDALAELGLAPPEVPSPLNLFMNIPWTSSGALDFGIPESRPGDFVLLEAAMDCVVAFSACPQDKVPINGALMQPTEAHFQVLDA